MKRCLFYGESPHNTTGFAQVNKHLGQILAEVTELEFVASTHWSPDLDKDLPYKIHSCPETSNPGPQSPESRNLDTIFARLNSREWDIFFHQGDLGANNDVIIRAVEIARSEPGKKFVIYYAPLDVDDCLPQVFDIMSLVDVPVLYTQRGVDVATRLRPDLAGKISAIGLGTEPEIFFPLSEEERKAERKRIFGIEDDTFVIINVNRNQMRKDLARTMACFHKFHSSFPHSMLYLHSVMEDFGGNLALQAVMVGMDITAKPAEVAFSSLDLQKPWARKDLNCLYNAADCLVSTSYGEGWGLTTTEAMGSGVPVCVPYNTANIDLLGPHMERGWGMKTGGDLDHTAYLYEGGGSPHDVVWSDSFLDNLSQIYYGTVPGEDGHISQFYYHQRLAKTQAAHVWCLQKPWKERASIWQALIEVL